MHLDRMDKQRRLMQKLCKGTDQEADLDIGGQTLLEVLQTYANLESLTEKKKTKSRRERGTETCLVCKQYPQCLGKLQNSTGAQRTTCNIQFIQIYI